LLTAAAGCASFNPEPITNVPFRDRALKGGDQQYHIEVAVPDVSEAARLFDRKLYKKDVQPVWLRLENKGSTPALFLPRALDAEYYSPLEVAYQYHSGCTPRRNERMDAWFLTNSIRFEIPQGETRSGFVFTHVELGSKHVNVALASENGLKRFSFTPEIPGLSADWHKVDWEEAAGSVETTDCDETRLRRELERLPRAVTDKTGEKEGDPLNLVIIANPGDLEAFIWSGWDETERITGGSAWRTAKSFLFGSRYRHSPVSALYVFGRPQDIALQKARGSVHLRNHLRLWLTPFRFNGKHVWVGQISRDIGVYFTFKSPSLTTRKIDPDVDETREYLLHDLLLAQGVRRFGYVKGVEAAPVDAPRHNLTGDPYVTDGLRAVIELTTTPTSFDEVGYLEWETPSDKARGVLMQDRCFRETSRVWHRQWSRLGRGPRFPARCGSPDTPHANGCEEAISQISSCPGGQFGQLCDR